MSKGIAYDNAFFRDYIVSDLIESIWATRQRKTLKVFKIHLDNAHPHNSKKSHECLEGFRAIRVAYPIYNPDVA
jgi:hypothetical protein